MHEKELDLTGNGTILLGLSIYDMSGLRVLKISMALREKESTDLR